MKPINEKDNKLIELFTMNLKPIVVNKNRLAGSKYLKSSFNINIIILDDAFQHRKINRDLDILLLNINTPIKNLFIFPKGLIRESFNNYKRADVLLLCDKYINNNFYDKKFYNELNVNNKFFVSFKFVFINTKNNSYFNPDLFDENIFAFCGIGDPQSFKNTLLSFDLNLKIFKAFKDHQNFNKKIVSYIVNVCKKK